MAYNDIYFLQGLSSPSTVFQIARHFHMAYDPTDPFVYDLRVSNERPAISVGIRLKPRDKSTGIVPIGFEGIMLYDVILQRQVRNPSARGTDFEVRVFHADPERFERAVKEVREELGISGNQ